MEFYRNEYPVKGIFKEHQIRALIEADGKTGHAYWMDPGAGKTLTCLAEASKLWEFDHIDGMLIVAPNGPHIQWITDEAPKWMDTPWHGVHNKISKVKLKGLMSKKRDGFAMASINYDALRTVNGQHFINMFMDMYPRIYLVLDESQKIKDSRALRTKEALTLADRAVYKRTLSGTPLLKGLEDLFTQYEAVKRGLTGFESYWAYRNYYCELVIPYGASSPHARSIVGYKNELELQDKTRNYATRVLASEFMKGETPDFMQVRTEMTAQQKTQYLLMKKHMIAMVDSGAVTASNALVQLTKLQQIAAGFVIEEDGSITWYSDSKINATETLLEDLNEPVLVWAPYRALQAKVCDLLREMERPFIRYTEFDDIKRWEDLDNGVMVGNQSSGMGVGSNLQHAAANIYIANSSSSEARWQSLKRTDRIGQTKQVRIWDLITPKSVDEKFLASLVEKAENAVRNIDALKQFREMIS